MAWDVPPVFLESVHDPDRRQWVTAAPARAAALADRWQLTPDGAPMSGYLAVVWPVRDATGRLLALKLSTHDRASDGEIPALLAAADTGVVVEVVESEPAQAAVLLERLDPQRTLEQLPDVDEACGVIGTIVAGISAVTAPPGVARMVDELARVSAAIRSQHDKWGVVLPRWAVDRALSTLADLAADLEAVGDGPLPLVHADCHFLNVLHTLPGQSARWKAIDPFPFAGLPEAGVVAPLRNRWADALGTGEPERALRRRVDIICEPAALDTAVARAFAQAFAVDNILWLLPDRPGDMFIAPYSTIALWRD